MFSLRGNGHVLVFQLCFLSLDYFIGDVLKRIIYQNQRIEMTYRNEKYASLLLEEIDN